MSEDKRPFHWGVSTAAYQTEGAFNVDGKGLNIWDVFSNTPKKIRNNENGNTACEFYHRYVQDLTLLKILNIPNFRFSLSWSRILPDGYGTINTKGIDHYHKVIDYCLELGIEPWITLYHWDLPEALEKKGGWRNREIISWFEEYTAICIRAFGDKVKNWIVLNEPMVFTGAGYFLGVHAPGKKGLTNFLAAAHHAAMCQSAGGRIIRSLQPHSNIGTTFSTSPIHPASQKQKDIQSAIRVDALVNRLFVEPLMGLGYPYHDLPFLKRMEPFIQQHDESSLPFDMDFIGIQNYTREIVSHSWLMPFIKSKLIKADKRMVTRTEMNWEVYPDCIYEILHKFNKYPVKKLIVTENGAAFNDTVEAGEIKDTDRKNYINEHIRKVLQARNEGVKVDGYFVWSLTDNFEWAEGFHPRFGLVHIDYKTQKRTIKNSGFFYSDVIKNAGGVL